LQWQHVLIRYWSLLSNGLDLQHPVSGLVQVFISVISEGDIKLKSRLA